MPCHCLGITWVFFERPFVKLALEKKNCFVIFCLVDAEGLGFATFSTISSVGR